MYAFDHGWSLTRQLIDTMTGKANENAAKGSRNISEIANKAELGDGWDKFIAFVGVIFIGLYIFLQYIVLLFIMSVIVVAHVLLLAILMGLALLLIGFLRLCMWSYARVYGIYYRCPRAYCYHEMPVPTFICLIVRPFTRDSGLIPTVYSHIAADVVKGFPR